MWAAFLTFPPEIRTFLSLFSFPLFCQNQFWKQTKRQRKEGKRKRFGNLCDFIRSTFVSTLSWPWGSPPPPWLSPAPPDQGWQGCREGGSQGFRQRKRRRRLWRPMPVMALAPTSLSAFATSPRGPGWWSRWRWWRGSGSSSNRGGGGTPSEEEEESPRRPRQSSPGAPPRTGQDSGSEGSPCSSNRTRRMPSWRPRPPPPPHPCLLLPPLRMSLTPPPPPCPPVTSPGGEPPASAGENTSQGGPTTHRGTQKRTSFTSELGHFPSFERFSRIIRSFEFLFQGLVWERGGLRMRRGWR